MLVADDNPSTRRLLRRMLESAGAVVTEVSDGRSVLKRARALPFDLVLLDLEMPGIDGLETLRRLRSFDPDLPVLMVSGVATVPISVQATRLGAYDFVEKPIDVSRLLRMAQHAVSHQRLLQVARDSDTEEWDCCCDRILGRSAPIRRLRQQIKRVARYDVPVLVVGESGVGKELVAHAIHKGGPRAGGPFVAFNAAAVPETLFESTLFGHKRGAFTGADSAQRGLMEEANQGTLVLDEIGDLSQANQAKLLRALETREIRPVGATRAVSIDVRVVACTNADLPALVKQGRYRADLYYRLRGVVLELPSLRDRPADIPELASHFLQQAKGEYDLEVSGFAPDVLDLFQAYRWPGNVRELKHAVTSAALMAPAGWVTAADLPAELQPSSASDPGAPSRQSTDLSLEAAERRAIERALRAAEDNRTKAAEVLGISRSALYRLLAKHGLG